MFHFGMTGSFAVEGVDNPSYKSFKLSKDWPPNFTKLELEFEGNVKLAFADPRRLGRIRFRENEALALKAEPLSKLAKGGFIVCNTSYKHVCTI
jgi:formamidopyrimidine-DNA glycosylase